jgi:hypothetical protein
MLVGLGIFSAGVWVFGILMFTFALDGAESARLPDWLEPFMLIGWPASVALVPIVPSLAMACGANWRWVTGWFLGASAIAAMVFLTGVVALFSSL